MVISGLFAYTGELKHENNRHGIRCMLPFSLSSAERYIMFKPAALQTFGASSRVSLLSDDVEEWMIS